MSFCAQTKHSLCEKPPKFPCCKKAMLYGILLPHNDFIYDSFNFFSDSETVVKCIAALIKGAYGFKSNISIDDVQPYKNKGLINYKISFDNIEDAYTICSDMNRDSERIALSLLNCDNCKSSFLKGLFISCGTVTDPQSGYLLEFKLEDKDKCEIVAEFALSLGFTFRITKRKQSYSLYVKESETVEDFLTYMGAHSASLEIMNVKIIKDIRNNENRRSNCDAANIYKATGAARAQIIAIEKLSSEHKLSSLPTELQMTARLRLEHPSASLAELALMHDPAISKSGVVHRIQKILDFCNK